MMAFVMGETARTVLCPRCGAEIPSNSSYCNKCGKAVSDAPATLTFPGSTEERLKEELYFAPGASFGPRYRIIEEIGRGGMGRVYKAEDRELGIVVALKMIRPEYSSSRTMIEHFKKETLLARSVSHENVVRTHDLGEVGPVRYISMDYIKGGNLEDLIRTSGQLSPETALRIMAQICEALKAAHAKGIIHQDLKPQNVLIDNSGKAYLTDFGLARSLAGAETAASGKIYGTPQYFAPEQARGEKADERSDIYSLGVILYEMLTGKPPFRAATIEEYVRKHTSEAPVPPAKVRPGLPAALDRAVLKCLEKRKEDRYASVDALLEDLRAWRSAAGAAAPPSKKTRVLRRTLAVLAILGLAGGAVWLGVKKKPVPPAAADQRVAVAVLFSVNTSQDKSLDHLRWEIPDLMITGLAQSKYLSLLPLDRLLQNLTKMGQLDAAQHVSGTLDKIGASESVDYFILPSFVRAGEKLWISAKIRKAGSVGIVDSAEVEGRSEDLVSMVQDLNSKVRSIFVAFPEDAAADYHQSLGKITTPSLEALGHYVESERLLAVDDYEGSSRALEKAVASDPGYALAYWKLAENSGYLGNLGLAKRHIEKALSLLDRASLRDRYLIQGYAALILEDSPIKAAESYRKLLAAYPNDETGMSYLGSIYRNTEEWDAAIEQYERLLKLNPRYLFAYENLAFVYTAKGWYEKALELLQASGSIFPEVTFFPNQTILIELIQGRYEIAAAAIGKALARAPNDPANLDFQAVLAHLRGDIASARDAYERLRISEEGSGGLRGRIGLARLALQRGRYQESRDEIQRGIEASQRANKESEEWELFWDLGYLNFRNGRFAESAEAAEAIIEASRAAGRSNNLKSALLLQGISELGRRRIDKSKAASEKLRQVVEKSGCSSHMRYYHLLEGKIALTEGRSADAVGELERALALLPHQRERSDEHAFFMEALADAYERAGVQEKAAETFRNILALTTGRLRWGDIFALSHFRLGRLLQEMNAPAEAVTEYEKFLGLWAAADPGFPEVGEAKRRLALLKKTERS